jgi:hypothetical protein
VLQMTSFSLYIYILVGVTLGWRKCNI